MNITRDQVIDYLRPLTVGLIGIACTIGLLGFRLSSLTAGVSASEMSVVQMVQGRTLSLLHILHNPLFLPHSIGLYVLEKAGFTHLFAIRGVGASFGLIGVIALYSIVRKWHTRRIAIFTAALFVTGNWFLHSSRLATPETTYLLIPLLIWFGIKLVENQQRLVFLSLAAWVTVLFCYLPSMIWFILPVIVWQRKLIIQRFRETNRLWRAILITLSLIGLIPLVYALITTHGLWQTWLGYRQTTFQPLELIKNLGLTPAHIFFHHNLVPALNLGHIPRLSVSSTVLVALGVYWYFFKRKLARTKLLVGGLIIGDILVALGGDSSQVI